MAREPDTVIFGAGLAGRHVMALIGRRRVRCVVDNDPRKWGSSIRGVPVAGPEVIDRGSMERIVIATIFAAEVYEQLLEMGIEPDRIEIASVAAMNGELGVTPRCALAAAAVVAALVLAFI